MTDPNETRTASDSLRQSSAPPPECVSRYRIEKTLGEGSFGTVYQAHDEELHRSVALKVFRRPNASLDEARIVASLDHPNIVPVYDVGAGFVVSKLIDGATLADRMNAGRFRFEDAAQLVSTIAKALHSAHQRKLIHRDIKPANILIDSAGTPFIADFGLALKENEYGQGRPSGGTPAYMSPEQARGDGDRVDGRSDIFSLGVVFYELLAGVRPFAGSSQIELRDAILTNEPRPIRQTHDAVPADLERICLKMLAKSPSDRYATAKDVADDLDRALAKKGKKTVNVEASFGKFGCSLAIAMCLLIVVGGMTVVLKRPGPGQVETESSIIVAEAKPKSDPVSPAYENKVSEFPLTRSKADALPLPPSPLYQRPAIERFAAVAAAVGAAHSIDGSGPFGNVLAAGRLIQP
jgi:serine/threonine protein kinase